MAYKISGRVLKKFDSVSLPSKSGNSYTKQDLVIAVRKFDLYTGEPSDDETNTPKFTFFGERINDLVAINEGDLVTIHFEISGRPFTKEDGKTEYFNDIRPLRVEKNLNGFSKSFSQPSAVMETNIPSGSGKDNMEVQNETKQGEDELPF